MSVNLRELLLEYHGNVEEEKVQEFVKEGCSLSFLQLRDRLYLLGTILFEDVENQVYVAHIRSGLGNMSGATIAMRLQGSKLILVGYAKEGLIKQRICEKAIQKLVNAAEGGNVSDSSKFPRRVAMIIAIITVVVLVSIRGCVVNRVDSDMVDEKLSPSVESTAPNSPTTGETERKDAAEERAFKKEVQQAIEATKAYNLAVEKFNSAVNEYNAAVVLTCIDNISGLPSSLEPLTVESETEEEVAEAIRGGNTKETIGADTNTVLDMEQQVKELTTVVKQITVPTSDWLKERLDKVDAITGMQAVTADNDPDGLLDKEGGFTDCVYFTVKEISVSSVPGKSIVEKGTDVGGAVEVYASLEEAKARCEYLAGFDGTVLYSGSYAIVGTMVVRTSYHLTNDQQIDLTSDITAALLSLD